MVDRIEQARSGEQTDMTFHCDGCDRNRDFWTDYGIMIVTESKEVKRICRICRRPAVGLPDVYWDGKPEINLADDPTTGKPRVFASKQEKANYLKRKGLTEAGDSVHGAPIVVSRESQPKRDSSHEVRMAIKQVREMGIDVRRQAYLKIIKERNRA
jgi:hypothetical protein